jgi:hypothetical protein
MLGAGGGWEHFITNIGIVDGGAETGFIRERLLSEVTIINIEKFDWCGLYNCLLEE